RHTRFSRDWSSDVCSSDLGCSWKIPWTPGRSEDWCGCTRRKGSSALCTGCPLPTSPGRKKCFEMGEADGDGATIISVGFGQNIPARSAGDRLFRRSSSGPPVGDPPRQGTGGPARGCFGGDDLSSAPPGSAGKVQALRVYHAASGQAPPVCPFGCGPDLCDEI